MRMKQRLENLKMLWRWYSDLPHQIVNHTTQEKETTNDSENSVAGLPVFWIKVNDEGLIKSIRARQGDNSEIPIWLSHKGDIIPSNCHLNLFNAIYNLNWLIQFN